MSFTKQWASPDNSPTLVTPADNATLDFYELGDFTWQPVMGAASYRLQIAACGNFSSPTYNVVTLATTHQPANKLPNGDYCWRVIPLDPANREGVASVERPFRISYNRIPGCWNRPTERSRRFTPTMRWTAVRGAQFYRLQYSTDNTFHTATTQVDTRNTSFTPTDDLPNDVNYYWRVAAYSGSSISDWSEVRRFMKKWYIQPELLTPPNNYGFVRDPLFSWTPVPGASYYKIEINCLNSFPPSGCGFSKTTSNPFYVLQPEGGKWLTPPPTTWYWQVTAYDRNNHTGKASNTASLWFRPEVVVPQLISPLYYYPPVAGLQPYEERSASLPLFTWSRQMIGAEQAAAYRLQVERGPAVPERELDRGHAEPGRSTHGRRAIHAGSRQHLLLARARAGRRRREHAGGVEPEVANAHRPEPAATRHDGQRAGPAASRGGLGVGREHADPGMAGAGRGGRV